MCWPSSKLKPAAVFVQSDVKKCDGEPALRKEAGALPGYQAVFMLGGLAPGLIAIPDFNIGEERIR